MANLPAAADDVSEEDAEGEEEEDDLHGEAREDEDEDEDEECESADGMHRHRERGGAAGVQGTAGTPTSQTLGAVANGCVLAQAPTHSSSCLSHAPALRIATRRGARTRKPAKKMKGTPSGRPYSRTRRSPEKKVRYTGRQCVTAFGLAACLRSLFSAIAVQVPGALRMLL